MTNASESLAVAAPPTGERANHFMRIYGIYDWRPPKVHKRLRAHTLTKCDKCAHNDRSSRSIFGPTCGRTHMCVNVNTRVYRVRALDDHDDSRRVSHLYIRMFIYSGNTHLAPATLALANEICVI